MPWAEKGECSMSTKRQSWLAMAGRPSSIASMTLLRRGPFLGLGVVRGETAGDRRRGDHRPGDPADSPRAGATCRVCRAHRNLLIRCFRSRS